MQLFFFLSSALNQFIRYSFKSALRLVCVSAVIRFSIIISAFQTALSILLKMVAFQGAH
jgi:hypothetical protein